MPTLIFEDEFGTFGTWNGKSGSPTILTSPAPASGWRTLELNALNEFVFWNIPDNGYTRVVFGVWLRFPAFPSVTGTRVFKIDYGLTEGWMRITASGEPIIRADGTPTMSDANSGLNLSLNTWYWTQLMADVSANPWELRFKLGSTVIQTTGAAAASNLNNGNFLLGNTSGESLTFYYANPMMGVAADDDDWWGQPFGFVPRELMTGRATSW